MFDKQIASRAPFVLLIVSFFMLSVFATTVENTPKPSPGPCDTTTDGDLVKAVQDGIKADHAFVDQRVHMSVDSTKRRVTLSGFVTSNALKKKAGKIAKAIKCVKSVRNNLFLHFVTSCGPGQKPCCGGCIDKTLTCHCIP